MYVHGGIVIIILVVAALDTSSCAALLCCVVCLFSYILFILSFIVIFSLVNCFVTFV